MSVIFPTTKAAFVAHQEQVSGRVLRRREREIAEVCVPLLNRAYRDGCAKDTDALRASLDRIDLCMVRYDGDLTSLRCFAAVKDWVSAAWAQGVQRGVTA